MASPEVISALAKIATISSQPDKSQGYNQLLTQVTSSSAASPDEQIGDLVAFSDSILAENLGIVALRPLLTSFVQHLSSHTNPGVKVAVGQHVLTRLQSHSASFEEQDAGLRETLAAGYEAQEDYSGAAKALQGIHLDTSQRQITDEARVKMWIRIVRLYLEEDDTADAESYLNRIKNLPSSNATLASNADLKLHFQLSQARILDARRRFLDASAEYLNVSLSPSVAEDDRLQALSAAIKTAVLAPAGPQRSKTLGKLYKDERATSTEEFLILEKMFLDRLLSSAEVEAFKSSLAPHQLAQTADGSTVLAKAVIEHNLLAASRLFENISIDALGAILGLTDSPEETAGEKAEEYAARMVEQGRLKGVIDQIDGVIFFETTDVKGAGVTGARGRELRLWDANVQGLVEEVERCAAGISEQFPVSVLALENSRRLLRVKCS